SSPAAASFRPGPPHRRWRRSPNNPLARTRSVPAQSLQTEAFILLKRPATDAFRSFTVFSAEHGSLLVLQRIPKKRAATSVALDLFDEVSLELETSNQGRSWFVREARLITRQTELGRGYDALRLA